MPADNDFMDAWGSSLEAAEEIMGENWSLLNGRSYSAIAIEDLTSGVTASPGGRFRESTLAILISAEVKAQSDVKDFTTVQARGHKLKVDAIVDDGDGSYWLMCGVKAPKF